MPNPPPSAPSAPKVPGRAPAGMIPAEAELLTRWLQEHSISVLGVTFNVRVGHGLDPGDSVPDNLRQMAIANSQRRVDAVVSVPGRMVLIEVKVRGSLWAIGQLLGYRELWLRDTPGAPVPSLLMLCASIDPDTAYCCTQLGVMCEVVPAGAPPSASPAT